MSSYLILLITAKSEMKGVMSCKNNSSPGLACYVMLYVIHVGKQLFTTFDKSDSNNDNWRTTYAR